MEARLVNRITGETITVNKPVFRIGREKGYVDFCIPNAAVSRHHCDLIQRDDGYYLMDLNSKNGTYLTGIKLSPHQEMRLSHADAVQIADVFLYFEEVR